MPTLASKLPYTHPFSGGFPYRGSQRLPSDPDALTYLAAVAVADGAPVETAVAVAVDDFIKGMKADGIWDAIKASCILCGARTITGALVPLVGAAPTNNSFLPEDYNRETGLVGNGSTKYLDSNSTGTSGGQNDAHFSVFCTALPTSTSMNYIGRLVIGGAAAHSQTTSSLQSFTTLNDNTLASTLAAPSANSLVGASRNSAANFVHVSGDATEVKTSTSQSQSGANNFHVFRRNLAASPQYSDARLAFYSIGESLDLALLDARVTALVNAIGAAL